MRIPWGGSWHAEGCAVQIADAQPAHAACTLQGDASIRVLPAALSHLEAALTPLSAQDLLPAHVAGPGILSLTGGPAQVLFPLDLVPGDLLHVAPATLIACTVSVRVARHSPSPIGLCLVADTPALAVLAVPRVASLAHVEADTAICALPGTVRAAVGHLEIAVLDAAVGACRFSGRGRVIFGAPSVAHGVAPEPPAQDGPLARAAEVPSYTAPHVVRGHRLQVGGADGSVLTIAVHGPEPILCSADSLLWREPAVHLFVDAAAPGLLAAWGEGEIALGTPDSRRIFLLQVPPHSVLMVVREALFGTIGLEDAPGAVATLRAAGTPGVLAIAAHGAVREVVLEEGEHLLLHAPSLLYYGPELLLEPVTHGPAGEREMLSAHGPGLIAVADGAGDSGA